jgi:hypothetical protein
MMCLLLISGTAGGDMYAPVVPSPQPLSRGERGFERSRASAASRSAP